MAREADVVVIGGGPGGYVCAIRSAQLGLRTVLVERDQLGGICVAYGCIPSKALISMTKLYEKAKNGAKFGILADGIRVDLGALQKWKSEVVSTLESGVAALCRGNKVEVIEGTAEVVNAKTVKVMTSSGTEEIVTKNLVIATGSRAISLPGLEFDGKPRPQLDRSALALEKLPESMLVIGGGYIGLESGGVYQKLGSKITIVELTDQLLPGTEPDLVRYPYRNLEKRGAQILLKSKVASLEKTEGKVKARVSTPNGEVVVEASIALVSVGRAPLTAEMNLARHGGQHRRQGLHHHRRADEDERRRGLRHRRRARPAPARPQGNERRRSGR